LCTHAARHALLPRTAQRNSSQNTPTNTFVSPPYFDFIRRSSQSAGTDPNVPTRAPLHDFFSVPRTTGEAQPLLAPRLCPLMFVWRRLQSHFVVVLALFLSKTDTYGSYKPPVRQSVSPIEATSLIVPTSTEGLSPESSWIVAAAPVGIGAGPSDYQGVLPAQILQLEETPTIGDRI
jgi:hypothetical protein